MQIIYIYVASRVAKAYGVRVIVDKMRSLFDDVRVTEDIDSLPENAIVIPYGLLASVSLWRKRKYKLGLSLMVDAYTLGIKSELLYFYRKNYVSKKFLMIHLLRYCKYLIYEYIILRNYKNIMLVSYNDRKYYQDKQLTKRYAPKIVVVPNGINLDPNRHSYRNTNTPKFRIGCLSNWDILTYYTLKDFLLEIWSKIDTSQMELVIAGRELTPAMHEELETYQNVKIIGEVKELNEFYDQIDASLITMVKECGIINRVLDGFAYRVPVITRPQSLLAFENLPDCCYAYTDANSFEQTISVLGRSYDAALQKTNVAYAYVRRFHDWDTNYQVLKDIVFNNYK